MEHISNINEINSLLQQYEGGDLQFYLYSTSLRRTLLRLWKNDTETVVYILATGCIHFTGNFDTENVYLSVVKDVASGKIKKLVDSISDFELSADGDIFLLIGSASEFDKDFQKDFLWLKE